MQPALRIAAHDSKCTVDYSHGNNLISILCVLCSYFRSYPKFNFFALNGWFMQRWAHLHLYVDRTCR